MNNIDSESLSNDNVIPVFDSVVLKSRLKPESLKILRLKEDQKEFTFECRQTLWIIANKYCASYSIVNLDNKLDPVLAVKPFLMAEKKDAIEFLTIPQRLFEQGVLYFLWYDGKQLKPAITIKEHPYAPSSRSHNNPILKYSKMVGRPLDLPPLSTHKVSVSGE